MLPLRGRAVHSRGLDTSAEFSVIRIKHPTVSPSSEADAALIHNQSDVSAALSSGFKRVVALADTPESFLGLERLEAEIVLPPAYDYLDDGDVIGIKAEDGQFRTLYRKSSEHNSFLVTERCNNYCLMCSQPPRNVNDSWLLDEIRAAIPLMDPNTKAFTFTGGEPLLDWRGFTRLLHQCRETLPSTAIHVLTNGRAFSNDEIVAAWQSVGHPRLTAGIPVYSAVDRIHDYVVQARGAFDETVLGILKLKDRGQRVEVRIVLHALTAPRIFETCQWLARNLPFLDHIAIMGLEHTGFALANSNLLSVDPMDYRDELEKAVLLLASFGMQVSIYNLPRCVLPRSLWSYAVQSISDWKRGYLDGCEPCRERPNCSGFFTTGRLQRSRGISPIVA